MTWHSPDSKICLFVYLFYVLFCFLQKQTVAFHGAFSLLLQCLENLAGEVEQLTLQGGKLALKVFKAITIIQEKRSVTVEVFTVLWYTITLGRGVLPMMAYTGRLCTKSVLFLGFRYIKGQECRELKHMKVQGICHL